MIRPPVVVSNSRDGLIFMAVTDRRNAGVLRLTIPIERDAGERAAWIVWLAENLAALVDQALLTHAPSTVSRSPRPIPPPG